jgi:hypothetical protein
MADNQGREIPRKQVLEEYDAWLGLKPRQPSPVPNSDFRIRLVYLAMFVAGLAAVIRWG